MIALLPFLLLAAVDAAPVAADAPRGPLQMFIAPSGEPFRVSGNAPYPVAAWFAGADTNGDGKIDSAEFTADFLRFFDTLDQNHDGAIDSVEKTRYENEVAPETMGSSWSGPSQEQTNAEWNSKFSDDVSLPDVDRPRRDAGERPTGAGRFDLLGLPEPVAAMDVQVRGRISRKDASEAAQLRFRQLDTLNQGFLTLDRLPPTPTQGRDGKRKKRR
jgi:hypothetical protein